MKYKIEILISNIIDVYENNDINNILEWYKENWYYHFIMGYCTFSVYKNGKKLSYDEEENLGFCG